MEPVVRRSPARCLVQLGPVALTVAWLQRAQGTVADGELLVVVWRGEVARADAARIRAGGSALGRQLGDRGLGDRARGDRRRARRSGAGCRPAWPTSRCRRPRSPPCVERLRAAHAECAPCALRRRPAAKSGGRAARRGLARCRRALRRPGRLPRDRCSSRRRSRCSRCRSGLAYSAARLVRLGRARARAALGRAARADVHLHARLRARLVPAVARARASSWDSSPGVLTLTPFAQWRRDHALHHASSGDLERRGHGDITDAHGARVPRAVAPRTARRIALIRHPASLLLVGPLHLMISQRFRPRGMATGRPQIASVWATNVGILALGALIVLLFGWHALLRRLSARHLPGGERGHLAVLRAAPVRGRVLGVRPRSGTTRPRRCTAARISCCRPCCSGSRAASGCTTCIIWHPASRTTGCSAATTRRRCSRSRPC